MKIEIKIRDVQPVERLQMVKLAAAEVAVAVVLAAVID